MLRTRVLTAVILLPAAVGIIYLGGLPLLVLVALLFSTAEVEFCHLVVQDDFQPSLGFGVGILGLYLLDAYLTTQLPSPASNLLQPALALVFLMSLGWQLFRRHQGRSIADWALTVASGSYLGICGSCLIRMRGLPDGFGWMLVTLCTIMAADTGAYFAGQAWGKHKLAPLLSPGKTWEGYLAGIAIGAPVPMLLGLLWLHPRQIDHVIYRLVLGLLISSLAPLGDLVISMIKRQVGAKDSGSIMPGHGGALDRLDSVLWAAVIGYYYILALL